MLVSTVTPRTMSAGFHARLRLPRATSCRRRWHGLSACPRGVWRLRARLRAEAEQYATEAEKDEHKQQHRRREGRTHQPRQQLQRTLKANPASATRPTEPVCAAYDELIAAHELKQIQRRPKRSRRWTRSRRQLETRRLLSSIVRFHSKGPAHADPVGWRWRESLCRRRLLLRASTLSTKRRGHSDEFMLETHARLKRRRERHEGDPIEPVAEEIADEAKLLGFDEMQVTYLARRAILFRGCSANRSVWAERLRPNRPPSICHRVSRQLQLRAVHRTDRAADAGLSQWPGPIIAWSASQVLKCGMRRTGRRRPPIFPAASFNSPSAPSRRGSRQGADAGHRCRGRPHSLQRLQSLKGVGGLPGFERLCG